MDALGPLVRDARSFQPGPALASLEHPHGSRPGAPGDERLAGDERLSSRATGPGHACRERAGRLSRARLATLLQRPLSRRFAWLRGARSGGRPGWNVTNTTAQAA